MVMRGHYIPVAFGVLLYRRVTLLLCCERAADCRHIVRVLKFICSSSRVYDVTQLGPHGGLYFRPEWYLVYRKQL